ncbi:MAG: sensor histidine kinase [Beutenbergiaceae bacterium]
MSAASSAPGLLGWKQLGGPERFETYTRWSLYGLFGIIPAIAPFVLADTRTSAAALVGYLAAAVAQAGFAIAVMRHGLDVYLGRLESVPAVLLAGLGVTTVAGIITLIIVVDDAPYGLAFGVVIQLAVGLAALTPILAISQFSGIGIAGIVVAVALGLLASPDIAIGAAASLVASAFILASLRITVWTVGVVWEQVRARQTDARLAVAEERLRFSRDLHDVFGRTLSAVAVKSEVAAALARRGDERGIIEMLEVRELAQGALTEVRELVQGYRRIDLRTELMGAREILSAAGVQTRIAGEELKLPDEFTESAAWVVREGVTNVVRHSDATTCTIAVTRTESGLRVTITNDGARGPRGFGSGLRGLSERLAARGGILDSEMANGTFTLTATLQEKS